MVPGEPVWFFRSVKLKRKFLDSPMSQTCSEGPYLDQALPLPPRNDVACASLAALSRAISKGGGPPVYRG
jgi:hypothetical protein